MHYTKTEEEDRYFPFLLSPTHTSHSKTAYANDTIKNCTL